MAHGRVVCICGKVLSQCRCPGPHTDTVAPHPCRCKQGPTVNEVAAVTYPASLEAENSRLRERVEKLEVGIKKLQGYCLVAKKQYSLNECGHDECVEMINRLAALEDKA